LFFPSIEVASTKGASEPIYFSLGSTAPGRGYAACKNVLVETDIPHPTCLYPNPKDHFLRVLADLDDVTKRRVLQTMPVELYRIALPA
jgi:hypothetical protein